MRHLLFIALLMFSPAAKAGEWRPVSVPGVFVPAGVTVSMRQATIAAGSFMTFAERLIAEEAGGWSIGGHTITPGWATYWAADGARRVAVRLVLVCGGRAAAAIRIASPTSSDFNERAAMAALDAKARAAC